MLSVERRWESFLSSWATRLADALTERWLPPNYIAEEHAHFGPSVEIDVATFEREASATGAEGGGAVATVGPKVWIPPAADGVLPAVFPDTFEVRVLATDTGPKLVAAIELISPGNKDRPAERRAFATKCASYLSQGISVIIVDIVTNRRANLHNEVLRVMEAADILQLPAETSLYAVAYRPLVVKPGDQIPVPGSYARDNATQGGMVLYKIPVSSFANRPLVLHITSPEGGREATVDLDV